MPELEEDVTRPSLKRPKTGFFSSFAAFINEGAPSSATSNSTPSAGESEMLDIAISTYREMPVLQQDDDPLRFWEANSTSTVLQPLSCL